MTYDELLAKIKSLQIKQMRIVYNALYAVMELHKPIYDNSCFDLDCCDGPYPDLCDGCGDDYPCPTIQEIEKALE